MILGMVKFVAEVGRSGRIREGIIQQWCFKN